MSAKGNQDHQFELALGVTYPVAKDVSKSAAEINAAVRLATVIGKPAVQQLRNQKAATQYRISLLRDYYPAISREVVTEIRHTVGTEIYRHIRTLNLMR